MLVVVARRRLACAIRNNNRLGDARRMSMGAPLATREQETQMFKRESPTSTGMEIDEFVMPPEPTFRPVRVGLSWLFGFYFVVAIVMRLADPSASSDVLKVQDDELLPKGRSMLFRERGIMPQQQQVEK